jgi:hypothetical protein
MPNKSLERKDLKDLDTHILAEYTTLRPSINMQHQIRRHVSKKTG